jgi:hypothetical protein
VGKVYGPRLELLNGILVNEGGNMLGWKTLGRRQAVITGEAYPKGKRRSRRKETLEDELKEVIEDE